MEIQEKIISKWRNSLKEKGWLLLMERWGRVVWDDLVMCKGKWCMEEWVDLSRGNEKK